MGARRHEAKAMLAVDWGTTSFRVYRLDLEGRIVDSRATADGILAVQRTEDRGQGTEDRIQKIERRIRDGVRCIRQVCRFFVLHFWNLI